MNTLGFLSMQDYWDSSPGVTAPFGELSPYARTFEKNTSEYPKSDDPKTIFFLFSHTDNATLRTPISERELGVAWDVIGWVVDQVDEGKYTSNADDFKAAAAARFNNLRYQFTTPKMVDNGEGVFAPSFVEWEDDTGATYKIWLSDNEFRNYPGGEVIYIPNMVNPDTWFTSKSNVSSELSEVTPTILFQRAGELEVREDGTSARSTKYSSINARWYQRGDGSQYIDVEFSVLIYGTRVENPTTIKAAIRNYLLENGSYRESEWMEILPEIFNPIEYIVVPWFGTTSEFKGQVDSEVSKNKYFSPIVNTSNLASYLSWVTGESENHVSQTMEVLPTNYKSLTLVSVPSANNDGSKTSIKAGYPLYMLVNENSADWSRVPKETQAFIEMLHRLMYYSVYLKDDTQLPSDIYRLIKNGDTYVAGKVNGETYSVLSRRSFIIRARDYTPLGSGDKQ